jgi:hypothetical protein
MRRSSKYLGVVGGILATLSNIWIIYSTWDTLSKFNSPMLVLPPLIMCSFAPSLAGIVGGLLAERRPALSAILQTFAAGVALWFGVTGPLFLDVTAAIILAVGATLAGIAALSDSEPLQQRLYLEDITSLFDQATTQADSLATRTSPQLPQPSKELNSPKN